MLGSKQDSFYANLSIFKCCTSKQMTVLNMSLFFKEHQSGPTSGRYLNPGAAAAEILTAEELRVFNPNYLLEVSEETVTGKVVVGSEPLH